MHGRLSNNIYTWKLDTVNRILHGPSFQLQNWLPVRYEAKQTNLKLKTRTKQLLGYLLLALALPAQVLSHELKLVHGCNGSEKHGTCAGVRVFAHITFARMTFSHSDIFLPKPKMGHSPLQALLEGSLSLLPFLLPKCCWPGRANVLRANVLWANVSTPMCICTNQTRV
jgi:hypothetical protein